MTFRRFLPLAAAPLFVTLSCKTPTTAEVKDAAPATAAKKIDISREQFFDQTKMYYVRVKNWDESKTTPQTLAEWVDSGHAVVDIYETDAHSADPCPNKFASEDKKLLTTSAFKLKTSGTMTKGTNKSSYVFKFKDATIAKMTTLSLNAMSNDPSQMREALAWKFMAKMGVPASGHTYAKFCLNDRYNGLYSVIETVDESYLTAHFKKNDKGNLYKANWAKNDLGAANLSYKASDNQQDPGAAYTKSPNEGRTYELMTNDKSDVAATLGTYSDFARLVSAINGLDSVATDKEKYFKSQEYVDTLGRIFHWREYMRWAATNMLLGSWDNYWAAPSNYFLYNSGYKDDPRNFMAKPFFVWVPWDYSNSIGISYWSTKWQYASITDWPSSTKEYNGGGKATSLPLIQNMLKNDVFLNYYLDAVEYALDNFFNPKVIPVERKALWEHVRTAAYLESDYPDCRNAGNFPCAHTGRQFSNHEVFLQGDVQNQLDRGNFVIEGIDHYVRMRHDSARDQLALLRKKHPKGVSNIDFSKLEGWVP